MASILLAMAAIFVAPPSRMAVDSAQTAHRSVITVLGRPLK